MYRRAPLTRPVVDVAARALLPAAALARLPRRSTYVARAVGSPERR